MQSRVYVRALNEIVDTLRLVELEGLLRGLRSSRGNPVGKDVKAGFADLIFGIDSGFTRILADPILKRVAEGLDFEKLLNRQSRTAMITEFQAALNTDTIADSLLFTQLYLSARTVLRLRESLSELLDSAHPRESQPGHGSIALEIEDYDNQGITLERLQTALAALSSLYEAIERHANGDSTTPIVEWIESGSNITVKIEGGAAIIAEIRKLFGGVWKAIRFAENEKIERDVETALKQVGLVQELDKLVAAGGTQGENAAHVRHSVMASMSTLLGAGVLPAELEARSNYSRTDVLSAVRDTKLLSSGTADEQAVRGESGHSGTEA